MAATAPRTADPVTPESTSDYDDLSLWERMTATRGPEVDPAPTGGPEDDREVEDRDREDDPVVAVVPDLATDDAEPGGPAPTVAAGEDLDEGVQTPARPPRARRRARPARERGTVERSSAPRSWKDYRAAGAVGVVVLALLAGVIVFGVQWWGQQSSDADREAAAGAARKTASDLTTLNYNTIDADVRRVMDMTTGDFRNQFTQSADPFTNVVRQAQVQTTSDVVASGVKSFGDGKATVLVAVRSQVRNSQSPDPQVRNYRMSLDLQRQGDQWLTSNVEFVP